MIKAVAPLGSCRPCAGPRIMCMLIDGGQREQIRGALKAAGVDHEVVS